MCLIDFYLKIFPWIKCTTFSTVVYVFTFVSIVLTFTLTICFVWNIKKRERFLCYGIKHREVCYKTMRYPSIFNKLQCRKTVCYSSFTANWGKRFWAPNGNQTRSLLISGETGFDSRLGLETFFWFCDKAWVANSFPLIYQGPSHLHIFIYISINKIYWHIETAVLAVRVSRVRTGTHRGLLSAIWVLVAQWLERLTGD